MNKKVSLANRKRSSELAETSTVDLKKQELMALQDEVSQLDDEPQNAAAKHLEEVRNLVAKLHAMVEQFESTSTDQRRAVSLHVQHKILSTEIKNAVQEKAKAQSELGIDDERNLTICQAFVDDVMVGLSRVGIKLNPLQLHQVKRRQF
jgi:hypothetical protein